MRRLLAVGAFLRKEALDVLRQPRLLVTLVLGPFLILLLFGLGYRDEVRPYRTVFVGDPASPLVQRIEAAAGDLGRFVDYQGLEGDRAVALAALDEGDTDAVVVLPDDPVGTVLSGEQAEIEVWHTRLDPIEQTAIDFAARIAVDQINSAVLAAVVSQGQQEASSLPEALAGARTTLDALDTALQAGDTAQVEQQADRLDALLGGLTAVAGGIERLARDATVPDGDLAATARRLAGQLERARTGLEDLRGSLGDTSLDDVRGTVADLRSTLDAAEPYAEPLLAVQADILVRPFKSDVESAVPGGRTITDYYAPAAIVLLLQQFGIAFGSLTFVRERQLGILEVFKVSPVSALQAVVGKYLAYLLLGGGVAAVLTAMVVAALGVPVQGQVVELAVVLGLVLFASIGLGFVISLFSSTDSQAVLSTMIVLLASLFFSGFFLSVDALATPAQVLSWALPATYGIEMLRDVMLRGQDPDPALVAGLVGIGVLLLAAVSLGARRRFRAAAT